MFSEIEARKRNIIYIRAILSLVIILLGFYKLAEITGPNLHIVLYLAALVASNFIFMMLPSRHYEGMGLHNIIFILDVVFVSLGAYWLASLDFIFFMMIFVTVFISAVGRSVKLSVVVSVVVNIFYFYIKSMMAQADVPGAREQSVLLNAPLLFMVALHSSYMAEKTNEEVEGLNRLKKSNQSLTGRVNDMNVELDKYAEYTERVYDSFREGVIIMDTNGIIKQFNKKSEAIFGIKRGRAVNFLYKEVHDLGDVIKSLADIKMKKLASYEKEMTVSVQGGLKHLTVNTVYITDKADVIMGYLCTIRLKITGMAEGV
jgi:PAS domain-containing protein